MRTWTIDLSKLDVKRLNGVWRESLLAKKGIEYKLRGERFAYQNHPQSKIFQDTRSPLKAVNTYLYYIFEEACNRGYNFNGDKIDLDQVDLNMKINVPKSQVLFEYNHLSKKLGEYVTYSGTNNMFELKNVKWNYEKS